MKKLLSNRPSLDDHALNILADVIQELKSRGIKNVSWSDAVRRLDKYRKICKLKKIEVSI